MNTKGFIPAHGGNETLLSFQKARIVYDGTVKFCECFLDRRDRTYDQIHQANYLLNQQIRQLEKAFLKEGGLRERMSKARIATRKTEI